MVDGNLREEGSAGWLQRAEVEFGRLAIYASLVGALVLLGWLLGESLTPFSSIVGFAVAIFTISAILPIIKQQLHPVLVDTLYYSAAIGATLVIFVAKGNERLANEIGLEMEEVARSLSQAQDRLSQIEAVQKQREDQLPKLRAETVEAEAAMKAPSTSDLLSVEADLSTDMIRDLGLDRLIAYLPQRLSRCDASRENLSSLNAQALQLETERNFSIGPTFGEVARGREFNVRDALLQGMIQAALEDVLICERFQRPAEQLLAASNSYSRLLGLVALSGLIDNSWVESEKDPQTVARFTQIEELEETRHKRDLLIGRVSGLEIAVKEGQTAVTASKADITARELELAKLEGDLNTAKTGPIVGGIARAKDWGDRVWPYLLIVLLGMKLARKPMLALK